MAELCIKIATGTESARNTVHRGFCGCDWQNLVEEILSGESYMYRDTYDGESRRRYVYRNGETKWWIRSGSTKNGKTQRWDVYSDGDVERWVVVRQKIPMERTLDRTTEIISVHEYVPEFEQAIKRQMEDLGLTDIQEIDEDERGE